MRHCIFAAIAALTLTMTGCPGAVDSFSSSVGGAILQERETEHLICGWVQFGDRVSTSCVIKPQFATG